MSENEELGCSNLPSWPGASEVYSRAYSMLGSMAANGHVTKIKIGKKRAYSCHVSDDMRDLIDALDKGDEERIKGLIINFLDRGLCIPAHSAKKG